MSHLFWWNNNSSNLWFSDLDSLLNPLPLQLTDFDRLHSFWFLLSSSSWLSCSGTDKFLYTIVLCLFPLSFFCGAFQESQIPLFRPTCWQSLFLLGVALNPVLPWCTAISSVRDLHFSYSCRWLLYHLHTLQEYRE